MTKDTVDGENTEYVQETSGEPGEATPIDSTDLNTNVENQEDRDAGGADASETSGTCEEFQIMVQFEGMDSNTFHQFVVSSQPNGGYYLEISRADTKETVKNLYLKDAQGSESSGIYTWNVNDLETKDEEGNSIKYTIKEMSYWWTTGTPTSIYAALINSNYDMQKINVTKVDRKTEPATLNDSITFAKGDVLKIRNQYDTSKDVSQKQKVQIKITRTEQPGSCDPFQITVRLQGMDSTAFDSFITNSIAKTGYYLEISRVDTGAIVKKLFLEESSLLRTEGTFTWNIYDLETKDASGKPIEYIVKEKNYWQAQSVETIIRASLKHRDGNVQTIQVTKTEGVNQAELNSKLTFEEGDVLNIQNKYNANKDTPQKQKVNIKLTLAGWEDTLDADKLSGMKLNLAPAQGYSGTKKELNVSEATQDGNTFTWTVDDVEVEGADFTEIPYVITESGYPWSDSTSITATANVICNTQKEQNVEGKLDLEKNTITFSSMTMCTEETDTIQITIDRGKCETFKIRTKLQGLDSSTLAELVKNSKADNNSGYYLAICRSDTGTIVKKLYLEDATPVTEAGTYGWEVNDLKTKDSSGNPISYIVKEINYQLKKSPTVDIDATLTDRDSLSVDQDTKNNQAVVNPAISFKASDTLEISHMYHVQYGNIKIQKTFDGLRDDDLESLINKSKSTAETGYYISMQEVTAKSSEEENSGSGEDSGEVNVTKLYLDQATRAEKTFTWELKDVKLAEEDGTLIQYTIAEHRYLPENYTLNYKRINVLASVSGREDPNIEVTQDEQQEIVTLAPTSFSTFSEETVQITNQYYQIKRTGKIRIRTHLDGLKAEEIKKLRDGSKKGNSSGFYIEIKQVKKATTLRALSSSETFSERLYLSDAISESSDNTVFSWDIDDIPILDELNQPISYQISQHNYPVGGYAETIVSADVTRSDSTVSDIGTTPDTEHGVAGLDDVSFNSDLDTTVDTVDIRNSYTNDFNMVCYDKNGKAVENAQVTIKNPVTGEILATGVTAGAGAGVAAGTVTIAGLTLPAGTTAVLTVAGTTIVIGLTAAGIYGYYKNRTNVIIEDPTKPDQPVTPDDPPKDPDDPTMKYITLTLKKEWKRAENEAPKGAKVKFSVYKSENGSTDTVKVTEVTMDGKIDNLEVRPWEVELKNLEGGIVQNKQVVKVYTYYVKEEPLDGYETTYRGETGTELPLIPIRAGGKTIQAVWACTGTDGNVTAINSEKYELPKTGGSGTWKYTTGGILLMTVSLLYGCTRGKKKRERRT